jgi:amidophosphoribosyltransferase
MVESVSKFSKTITDFDVSVFTGEYVTGDIDEAYILELERLRSDSVKADKVPLSEDVVGLHNHQFKLRIAK